MAQTNLGGSYTFKNTSMTVKRMGFGAMQLCGPHVFGEPKDRPGCLAVVREALHLGINHIDTSDFYGPHVANQIIKEAIHPYPKDLVLVTKVGAKRGADGSWNAAYSAEELTSAVHDNLRNLGLEAIDIVNLRMGAGAVGADGQLSERLNTLVKLKKQGLIREIGLSNVNAAQYNEAKQLTEIVCAQNQYNLAHREDDAFVDQLAKDGVAFVPFFPLGGFKPLQSTTLEKVAASLETTPMQVALAWLLQRSPNILLIAGTSKVAHLRENIKAVDLKIPSAALNELNKISKQGS